MDRLRALRWSAVAVVVTALLMSGPSVGLLEPSPERPATVGDGNASVSSVVVPGEVSLDRGRFGTGVFYLRLPDVRVTVGDIRGAPRLRYHVDVGGLSVHDSVTKVLDEDAAGTHRLRVRDRAFQPEAVSESEYVVTLTVRVQSFDGDWTVSRRTHTVGVGR